MQNHVLVTCLHSEMYFRSVSVNLYTSKTAEFRVSSSMIPRIRSSITDLFFQPHICWKAVGRNLAFALVEAGTFLTAPASFISAGIYNKTVLAFLCSTVGTYFVYKNSDTTGAGDIMLNIQSLIKFPIPKLNIDFDNFSDREIDLYIYDIYKFTKEEIHYIEEQV